MKILYVLYNFYLIFIPLSLAFFNKLNNNKHLLNKKIFKNKKNNKANSNKPRAFLIFFTLILEEVDDIQ